MKTNQSELEVLKERRQYLVDANRSVHLPKCILQIEQYDKAIASLEMGDVASPELAIIRSQIRESEAFIQNADATRESYYKRVDDLLEKLEEPEDIK